MVGQKVKLRYSGKSAKETLAILTNTWLEESEIKTARDLAKGYYSEAECEDYLQHLEQCCTNRLFRWQQYS